MKYITIILICAGILSVNYIFPESRICYKLSGDSIKNRTKRNNFIQLELFGPFVNLSFFTLSYERLLFKSEKIIVSAGIGAPLSFLNGMCRSREFFCEFDISACYYYNNNRIGISIVNYPFVYALVDYDNKIFKKFYFTCGALETYYKYNYKNFFINVGYAQKIVYKRNELQKKKNVPLNIIFMGVGVCF